MFLMASFALTTGAAGQQVYKCGSSYSQEPCPGASVIDVTDQRTSEQKMQTDMASRRDATNAASLEKTRLQQEKIDRAARKPLAAPKKKTPVKRAAPLKFIKPMNMAPQKTRS
jgi:hypothetical protein